MCPPGTTSPTLAGIKVCPCSFLPFCLCRGSEGRGGVENLSICAGRAILPSVLASLNRQKWTLSLLVREDAGVPSHHQRPPGLGLGRSSCSHRLGPWLPNVLDISELLRTNICSQAGWAPGTRGMCALSAWEGRWVLRCQEEMALDPVAHVEWCLWGLGCLDDEQMAVSWVCFWERWRRIYVTLSRWQLWRVSISSYGEGARIGG